MGEDQGMHFDELYVRDFTQNEIWIMGSAVRSVGHFAGGNAFVVVGSRRSDMEALHRKLVDVDRYLKVPIPALIPVKLTRAEITILENTLAAAPLTIPDYDFQTFMGVEGQEVAAVLARVVEVKATLPPE